MLQHRGTVNRLRWLQEKDPIGVGDVVMQKTPYVFDVSIWELFWPLLSGARLAFTKPGGHTDPTYIAEFIEREGVTVLHFVPSMLDAFCAIVGEENAGRFSRVRIGGSSGEALSSNLVKKFHARFSSAVFYDLYGPTEASIEIIWYRCPRDPDVLMATKSIGYPVVNCAAYILDPSLQPIPVGAYGELCLGGVQLARGYLNRPRLTNEVFTMAPGIGRIYRTGDLCRHRQDGRVEYVGRLDFQVKIRGFRVELGEIESVLRQHPAVREACVMVREDKPGDKRVVAYIISHTDDPEPAELTQHVGAKVPAYMVPSAYVALKEFPLNLAGKTDRKRLPAPDYVKTAQAVRKPETPTEETVELLYRKHLGVDEIGTDLSFFDAGGHSLLAVHLLADIRRVLGIELPLRAIF
jgi:acyl-coenzyme A synthetase/AMP-(fatty) acid ligase